MINSELNAIKLDADSGLRRDLRKPIAEKYIEHYKNGLLGEYDTATIFYDVFLSDDCRSVIALGPVLLNLKKVLLPVSLVVNNRVLPFKIKINYKKLLVLAARLPGKLSGGFPIDAELSFANGFRKIIRLHPPTPLYGNALITLQKDNKIEWMKDWTAYYRSQFDIQHVVIYDNSSSNQAEVVAELEGIAKVIPWPFPYGTMDRAGNMFAQVGMLNHFKLRYARSSLIFNFDVDELLVCKTEKARRAIHAAEKLRLNGFFVPQLLSGREDYGYTDFLKREATAQNSAYKYIVHSDIPGIMNVHYFHASPLFLQRLLPKNFSRGPVLPVEDAYFLHYRGITGKRGMLYDNRVFYGERKPENMVDDYSVIDAFESLRLK